MKFYLYIEIGCYDHSNFEAHLKEIRNDAGIHTFEQAKVYANKEYPSAKFIEVMEVTRNESIWR